MTEKVKWLRASREELEQIAEALGLDLRREAPTYGESKELLFFRIVQRAEAFRAMARSMEESDSERKDWPWTEKNEL